MDPVRAIERLVYRYAECIDLGRFEDLPALWTAEGTFRAITPGGTVSMPARDLPTVNRATVQLYDGVPGTRHVTTNLIVDLADDERSAEGRCYFTVVQAVPGLPMQAVIAGRYLDRFVLEDGQWLIADRLVDATLFGDLSHHLVGNPY